MRQSLFGATVLVVVMGCAPEGGRPSDSSPWGGGIDSVGDGVTVGDDDAGAADETSSADESEGSDAADETVGAQDIPAAGVSIGQIEANQAVAVLLADAAGELPLASRNAELIQGRTTLVRAQWILAAGAEARMIEARLELLYPDGRIEVLSDEQLAAGPSSLSDLDGAFTWELGPELVEPGVRYRIALFETDGGARDGATDDSEFPRDGADADLAIRPEQMAMEVVLIPVATDEGSVVLGATELATIEARLLATYPLQDIEIRLRAPWIRDSRLSSLNDAFDYMASARVEDGESGEAYYHLVLDESTCCTGQDYEGWAGIAILVEDPYAGGRDGITKLYPQYGDFALDVTTMVHEIGHNHGRDHAPCGEPGDPDPLFPYPNAGLGVRGYDIDRGILMDPMPVDPTLATYADFMSYCGPQWWSDYSWRALIERVRLVTGMTADAPDQYRWRLRGFARPSGIVSWSWIRVPDSAAIGAGTATLSARSELGDIIELPVRVSNLADTDIVVLEADPPPSMRLAELELHLAEGDATKACPTTASAVAAGTTMVRSACRGQKTSCAAERSSRHERAGTW